VEGPYSNPFFDFEKSYSKSNISRKNRKLEIIDFHKENCKKLYIYICMYMHTLLNDFLLQKFV